MVIEKLKQIIAEQFGIDTDAISEETDIVADLGADSLDVVEMMMALEEEYGVTIDDNKIAELKTILFPPFPLRLCYFRVLPSIFPRQRGSFHQ